MATVIIRDPINDDQARVIDGVLQTSGSGGGGGGSTDLISVGGSPIALGQATSTQSLPVVIASDQSPIPVLFSNGTQTVRNLYGSQSAVAVGTETVIATYTAPASPTTACLQRITFSGQNVAQWIINNNGTVFEQNYTTAANLGSIISFMTGSFTVPGLIINPGNIITVSVIQIGLSSANFNARIQILELS